MYFFVNCDAFCCPFPSPGIATVFAKLRSKIAKIAKIGGKVFVRTTSYRKQKCFNKIPPLCFMAESVDVQRGLFPRNLIVLVLRLVFSYGHD